MLGPDLGPRRAGRLIAVAVRRDAGRRIVAEMAVHVDDPGRDISCRAPSITVAPSGAPRSAPPTAWTLPSASRTEPLSIRPPSPSRIVAPRISVGTPPIGLVGRRIGVLVDPDRARLGLLLGVDAGRKARDGDQPAASLTNPPAASIRPWPLRLRLAPAACGSPSSRSPARSRVVAQRVEVHPAS